MLKVLEKELAWVEKQLDEKVKAVTEWQQTYQLMTSVPGIGNGVAYTLLGELPELVVSMEAASGCRCRQARARPTCPPQRVRRNGAARGCPVLLATDSDRQSGRAGYRLEGGGGRRTVMRVVPVRLWPPGRW